MWHGSDLRLSWRRKTSRSSWPGSSRATFRYRRSSSIPRARSSTTTKPPRRSWRRFAETGELALADWATGFEQTDDSGAPLDPAVQPLVVAVTQRRPAHGQFWIRGHDGVRRHVEVTGLPLVGTGSRYVGAIAYFWTLPEA